VSNRRNKKSALCDLARPMNRRLEKSEIIPNDRRQSPRMQGPAACKGGEASVPPPFAAIVRVVPPPTRFIFPPRFSRGSESHVGVQVASVLGTRHSSLDTRPPADGGCGAGNPEKSSNKSPLQTAGVRTPAAGAPVAPPRAAAGL